jgi:hypothetical protein
MCYHLHHWLSIITLKVSRQNNLGRDRDVQLKVNNLVCDIPMHFILIKEHFIPSNTTWLIADWRTHLHCNDVLPFYIFIPVNASSTSKYKVFFDSYGKHSGMTHTKVMLASGARSINQYKCKNETSSLQWNIYLNQQCVKKDKVLLDTIRHSLLNSSISKCYNNVLQGWMARL